MSNTLETRTTRLETAMVNLGRASEWDGVLS